MSGLKDFLTGTSCGPVQILTFMQSRFLE